TEVIEIVTLAATDRQNERERLTSTTGTSYPLLIVEPLWWHVRLEDRLQRTDVDPHFHGCGDRKQIDRSGSQFEGRYRRTHLAKKNSFEPALAFRRVVRLTGQFFTVNSEDGLVSFDALTQKIRLAD